MQVKHREASGAKTCFSKHTAFAARCSIWEISRAKWNSLIHDKRKGKARGLVDT